MRLRILLIEMSFYLPGCTSLKEKRHRLAKLADKLGKLHQLAVCETGCQDNHQQSVWSAVLVGNSRALVDQLVAQLESVCLELDAVTLNIRQEWLG